MSDFKLLFLIVNFKYFCIHYTFSTNDISENVQEVVNEETTTEAIFPSTIEYSNDALRTNDIELVINQPKKARNTSALCPEFIYSAGFKMDKMPDVWLPVYYNMPDKLKCFKILITRTSEEELKQYENWYGNFNGTVNWRECHFEIRSTAVKDRKHFLQGGVGDLGVMRNIVLLADDNGNYNLHEETPDQWLMSKDLMLLRDCETGGMVVFARVPQRPRKGDILEALEELGEEMTGHLLCEDP